MSWHSIEKLNSLIDNLHCSALDPTHWREFALALDKTLGGSATSLHGVEISTGTMFSSTFGDVDLGTAKKFFDYYYAINPLEGFALRAIEGIARPFSSQVPDELVLRSEFYNDLMRPTYDLFGGGGLKARAFGTRSLVVSVTVPRLTREQAETRAVELLSLLEPHISHAFHVNEVLAGLSARLIDFQSDEDPCLEGAAGGVIITDADRLVAWATDGILGQATSIANTTLLGKLSFRDPVLENWAAHFAQGIRRRHGDKIPSSLKVTSGGEAWTVRALPTSDRSILSPAFPAGYGISKCQDRQIAFILSRDQAFVSREQRLCRRYGLSRAEASIAIMIAEGHETREIADIRRTSLHTVRNQVRTVLSKMDARNRREVTRGVLLSRG
ncbi:helix-turn-helix transcriptional regulator [Paracoccus sp. KR1-242]|uniref:helix-turn-helix transcriptional regulator n=1 Tax=Paracoccus sp. KR1-242 TaxID=3410028 RepID=UPI003C004534